MAKKQQTQAAEPQDQTQTPLAPPEDAAMTPQDAQQPQVEPNEPVQPVEPPEPSEAPVPPVVPPADPIPAEPLGAFIARHEDAAMALGIVVTLITHPDAEERVHAGRYGGIRLAAGDALATYSDGTQHE
ncbi:hypothetical protein RAS14_04580 [Achromobacter aegrifaciens]|uniref:hypothetical protein n=1 Tax=Achromobacter aegrifaciens TaxID=1287736 RepID=UPI0027901EF3|nr:hypothetical protein [Achromobacter aegrifaciens]MDQ1759014.1 hypothetical protein [Achromobacter aegrifaciens]